jgi:hypothetical protein
MATLPERLLLVALVDAAESPRHLPGPGGSTRGGRRVIMR